MHAYYFSSMHNLVLHFKVKLSRFNSKQTMFFKGHTQISIFVPEVGNALTCVIVLSRELCAGVNNGMPVSKCKNFVELCANHVFGGDNHSPSSPIVSVH
jgi:hypothetical protein